MAEFNADILLKVVTSKVDQALDKLEGRLDRINQAAANLDITPKGRLKDIKSEIDSVGNSFKRLGATIKNAGLAGALGAATVGANALGQALQNISFPGAGAFNALGDSIAQATGPVASLVNNLTSLAAAAPLTAGTIAATTVALTAFGPQIRRAATDAQIFGAAAKADTEALFGLNEAFELTAAGAKKLSQAFSAAGLRAALADATKEQQNLVAGSDDFAKATRQVLDLEEQVTAELRAQDRVVKSIKQERLAGALKNIGTDQFTGTSQPLLPAFQERGLQELNTGYAEALRLTQQRNAAIQTTANVERALTEETTRGVRFREKSAEAAQRLRDYTGNVLQSAQGIGRTYQASARVQMSWNVALGQMRDLSTQIGQTKKASKKIDESSLKITYAQIEAQKHLADVEKKRAAAAEKDNAARAKRLESIALGVGFPLLFGAGGGSVLGSLAGSFAGQGFGGQILGGAIGQVFDDLAARTAELGRALNPLTADLDLIIERVGLVGTETATYIKALEDADQSTEALAAATRELEAVIGKNGVIALQNFGDQTQDFANQWQIAMTQMGLALSALLSGPLAGVISNLERANALRSAQSSNDPVLQDLLRQRNEAGRPGIFGGGFGNVKSQLEINDQIVQRTRELANERANAAKEIEKSNELDLTSLNLLEAQIALEKSNGDLTNAAVFALEEKIIRRQAEVDLQAAGNDQTKIETALLQEQLRIIQLKNRADAARAKAAAASAKTAEAEQKRVAALQAQLNTSTALLAIDKQIAAAKVAGDQSKLAELEYTRALEASELKIAEIRARRAGEAETQLQIQREENRLEKELLDIDTKRALERQKLEKSFQTTVEALTIELGLAQAVTREEENRLKIQQKRLALEGKGFDEDQVNQIIDLEKKLQAAQAPIQSYITQTQKWLNDTESMIVSLGQSIETSISGAITGAVDALVTGSKTVQEVLSEMFAQIGRAFVNMAAEIIAKQLVMIALQGILKALGGASGGGGNNFNEGLGIEGTLAGEGIFSGSGPYKFAEGGYVTGPTNAIVGEGGQSEYIIPASKMSGAMSRWNAGMRGSDVIDGPGGSAGGGSENKDVPTFRLETTVINEVEYATVDQVRAMGERATIQGSHLGEQRALRKLQMSSSTRRRVGI